MSQITNQKSKLLARLQEKIPEQKVGLVPGDAFFTRKIDLPEGIPEADRMAFIQLNLEGNSPFPMEQLAWGFLEHPQAGFAYAYASPKARLKRLEIDQLEKYHQLFPGFITLYGDLVEKPTVRFISQCGVLSALFLVPGHPVPEKIVSRRIAGELLTDDIQLEARQLLLAGLQMDAFEPEDGLWLGEGVDILASGALAFRHRHVSKGESMGLKLHELNLNEHTLWNSDLRDEGYAAKEGQVRQRSKLIWKSVQVGGWTAILLVILQLLTLGLSGFNLLREKKINQLEPDAVRVENKITLATRLTQSTEEDIKPFLLMESINPLRPNSIYFDKVRSSAFNELEIEGNSTDGVTPVNAFSDSISQLPFVSAVENNSQTRNNQTSFELVITFSAMPPAPEGGFIMPEESSGEETDTENPDENG
ncbi:MAG: hypothetical protein AB3N64_08015 [Puniceicoccaceae bacterium]